MFKSNGNAKKISDNVLSPEDFVVRETWRKAFETETTLYHVSRMRFFLKLTKLFFVFVEKSK